MWGINNKLDSGLLRGLGLPAVVVLSVAAAGCEIKPSGERAKPADSAISDRAAASVDAAPARFLSGAEGVFSVESYKGRPLLVAVLGAGTHDLLRAVRQVNAVYEESQASGLAVVGLLTALDPNEDAARVADGLNAIFPIARATPAALAALGGARALPTYVLVDGRGAVRKQLPGAVDMDDLRTQLRDLAADAR